MFIVVVFLCFLLEFQQNVHATNMTSGQMLDKSIETLQGHIQRLTASTKDLEQKYNTLDKKVNNLKKLHVSCAPCKASTEATGVCDCTDIKPRRDCLQFYLDGYKVNGVYRLQEYKGPGFHTLHAYCDQTTRGGGWTVFQRRQDGSVDFHRNWIEYKKGFGNIEGEFWFGNENVHDLTKSSVAPKKSQLLINMRMKGQNKQVYAKYNTFEITDLDSKYTLKINGFTGNATNSPNLLDYNNNQKFTTYDADNDSHNSINCASTYKSKPTQPGGWWYGACSDTLLNGKYSFTKTYEEIAWDDTLNWLQPEFVEMKFRRNL